MLEDLILVEVEEDNILLCNRIREDEAVQAPNWVGLETVVHEDLPFNIWIVMISETLQVQLQVLHQVIAFNSKIEHVHSVNLKIGSCVPIVSLHSRLILVNYIQCSAPHFLRIFLLHFGISLLYIRATI